jgi:exonuclease SbcD
MRILHTSDWHLGRALEGRSRQAEQEDFVEELCSICEDEKVDLVLVAGDVFDTFNPSAQAEELYYRALDTLTAGGNRAVVVIAGNHDSPDRLRAVAPLAMRRGAFIMGLPRETVAGPISESQIILHGSGPGWLELGVPGCLETAVVSALPYPSEARLQQVLSAELSELNLREAYSAAVGSLMSRQAELFREETINLAVSHLYVCGGAVSDSERPIELGGAYSVQAGHVAVGAQYTALGHLHRAQRAGLDETSVHYSGSPLAYSFSEAGHSKSVNIIEVRPGRKALVKVFPLSSGIPLERWTCLHGVQEAVHRLEALDGRMVWLDLDIHSPRYLSAAELTQLRLAHSGTVNIRCTLTGDRDMALAESLSDLSMAEMFARFYRHRRQGTEPSQDLVRLFGELADRVAVEEAGVGQ